MADDNWSIFSADGSLAAHFEFTIAVTADGPRILTPWHEAKVAGRLPEFQAGPGREVLFFPGAERSDRPGENPSDRPDVNRIPCGRMRNPALLLLSAFAPAAHRLCCARLPPR